MTERQQTTHVDVLVVGAGSAGAAAAGALARRGRSVLLVDPRGVGGTGARWVNAVPAWCFDEAGVAQPAGDELWKHGGTFTMVAPGGGARVRHDGREAVLHVDMRHLVRRLVDAAVAAGARFVTAGVAEVRFDARGRVEEVALRTPSGAAADVVRPRLVLDASGLRAVVRERVPALRAHGEMTGDASLCLAAQYQYRVRDPAALAALLARHGAAPGDDLAFPGTCGGYSTLTLFTRAALDEVGVLAGSIPATGALPGAAMIERFAEGAPWLGERLFGGAGPIPVRRLSACLGADGVALVGDAAFQVFASHGSGVGMGLCAARLLGELAAAGSDPGGEEVLRGYDRAFRARYGGLLLASDAFRRFSQGLDVDTLGDLLRAGLVDDEAFSQALAQRPTRPSAGALWQLARRAARAPGLARRLGPVVARTIVGEPLGGLHVPGALRPALERLLEHTVGAAPRGGTATFVHPERVPG